LAHGMKRVGDVAQLPLSRTATAALMALFTPWVAVAVVLLVTCTITYTIALSWADLSYVVPTTAIGYVLTVLLSRFVLHESISPTRWVGTALIACGVILVARTR